MENTSTPKLGQVMKGQIGETKVRVIEEPFSKWGMYVWVKPDGKFFTNEDGDVLNIPSMRDDQDKIKELRQAAAYYGQPDGKELFMSNIARVSEETHSEQVDRMSQGLIPSMNDLGALIAAKQTIDAYGVEAYNAD
jgi:hypothetical protein